MVINDNVVLCNCNCHQPGMSSMHMVACCCGHGYKIGCPKCTPEHRHFAGTEITEDYVDDLVEEWHNNDMPTSQQDFIIFNTGWTVGEYFYWLYTGKLP